MKVSTFYERLSTITEPSSISFSPGPLVFKVGVHDALAARLLMWLANKMPENATVGDQFEVLDAAMWWATFWASLDYEWSEPAPDGDRLNRDNGDDDDLSH